MFTGLVSDRGTIRHIRGATMEIAAGGETFPFNLGASIACNGICLTVTAIKGAGIFTVDLSPETLRVTTAGNWREGDVINLEPSLAVGDRLGGHFVSGHVDGVAVAIHQTNAGDSTEWLFEAPESLAKFIAPKGSVTLDGVSLTVNTVEKNAFGLTVIPHTAAQTGFGNLKLLDRLNLEVDMLARYVARLQECA